MSTLEDRYRRLLALYPAEHRRLFGDEMLGVLMSSAGEGQRRPRLGESADLMWHALWRRMGGIMRSRTHGHWSLAAAVVGVIGPLWLFALHLQRIYSGVGWYWPGELQRTFDGASWYWIYNGAARYSPAEGLLGAVELALVLTVLFGRRWLVIPMAWAVAAVEVYLIAATPVLVVALTTAVALSVPQPVRGGLRLLGGRGVVALAALAVLSGAKPIVSEYYLASPVRPYLTLIFVAVAAIAGLAVLRWRLDRQHRRDRHGGRRRHAVRRAP